MATLTLMGVRHTIAAILVPAVFVAALYVAHATGLIGWKRSRIQFGPNRDQVLPAETARFTAYIGSLRYDYVADTYVDPLPWASGTLSWRCVSVGPRTHCSRPTVER